MRTGCHLSLSLCSFLFWFLTFAHSPPLFHFWSSPQVHHLLYFVYSTSSLQILLPLRLHCQWSTIFHPRLSGEFTFPNGWSRSQSRFFIFVQCVVARLLWQLWRWPCFHRQARQFALDLRDSVIQTSGRTHTQIVMDLPHDDGPAYVGSGCGKMIKHSCGGKHQTVCKKTKLFRRKFSVCRFGSNAPPRYKEM